MTAATTPERHVALYTILVDGEEIDERLARRIREVRVLNYLRLPDVCTFSATFPKGADGVPEPIDEHPFAIGSHLEIKLGAREELTTSHAVQGRRRLARRRVRAGERRACSCAASTAPTRCSAREACARSRTTPRATSSRRSCGRPASSRRPTRAATRTTFVQQDNETDWDFIWRLAERIGFEFVVEDGTAHFRRQTHDETPLQLEWPMTLRSFNPRVTAIQQVKQVTLAAQDPKTKQAIDVTRRKPAAAGADRHRARDRPATRSTARASTSRPSRWRATPRDRPSRRRCSTSSPTHTSPPRASATGTPGSGRARRST